MRPCVRRLLPFFLLLAASCAFPSFRDELPNGLRSVKTTDPEHGLKRPKAYRALGHIDPSGGGDLNVFGEAFRNANFEWTEELCRADADGDGESNGHELGDPCCVWRVGDTPYRQWSVSHPGIFTSTTNITFNYEADCVRKEGNADFWAFYFETHDGAPHGTVTQFKTVGVDIAEWWKGKVAFAEEKGGFWNGLMAGTFKSKDSMLHMNGDSKNIFSLLVVMTAIFSALVFALSHRCGRRRRSPREGAKETSLSLADHVKLFVLCWVYTDLISGLLHVVLDNPLMNTWPVIGPEAAAFQGHHFDPTAVARGPILDMVREADLLVALQMIVGYVVKPSSPGLLVFGIHFGWMTKFMMASHRWSHTHPKYLHWSLKCAQQLGLILTTEHHSRHHAYYDANFCIFSGICNPILNKLIHVLHWQSPLWFFVLFGSGAFPAVLTIDSLRQWCVRAPVRLAIWFLGIPEQLAPNSNVATRIGDLSRRHLSAWAGLPASGQSKDKEGADEVSKTAKTNSCRDDHFVLILQGFELTGPSSRRVAAVLSTVAGVLATSLMVRSLVLRDMPPPMLVTLHVTCMALATLVLTTAAVSGYAFVSPGQEGLPAVRRRHRALNSLSALTLLVGVGLIFTHILLQRGFVWRPESTHMWLALASLAGVAVQASTGILKAAALRAGQPGKFKWHGTLGWAVYVCMLFAVNSGIVESSLFEAEFRLQMALQALLLGIGLSAAHALDKLPAVRIDLEDPVSHLLREHLGATMPELLARWLTSPPCVLGNCRPAHFDEGPAEAKDAQKEFDLAPFRRKGVGVFALCVFGLVAADVLRVDGPPVLGAGVLRAPSMEAEDARPEVATRGALAKRPPARPNSPEEIEKRAARTRTRGLQEEGAKGV